MSTATLALLAVFALVLLLLAREVLAVLMARAPREVHEVSTPGPSTSATIPKRLWTYWHEAPPPFVAQCLANWQRMAPDHELQLLCPQSMLQWIPADEVRSDFASLPPYRQADWLRIHLLARHGGIWVDASTILSRDLAWVHERNTQQGREYVGFYIGRYTQRLDDPIVENWFMASVPGGAFARALADEFDRALDIGAEAYLDQLRSEGRHARIVQGLGDSAQRYLLMHVCAARLLDDQPRAYALSLQRAEDTAFAFLAGVGWRKRHLFARLALVPAPRRLPVLIKLRGGDRDVVARNLAQGRWIDSSIVARLLDLRR
ncbi:glycosyltransferase family 32 protein [Pelomonas sp. KK5]|uniref:glycosyltransferase family 32 protein n=1 Tax=Pelomonas sp. KK5 TaxID=1855730 RepID=UPI00097BE496|nr:capsular polysaccharide synthesis protein [Pelomonas sp. KK5]